MTLNPFRKIAPPLRIWVALVVTLVIALAGVTIGYLAERGAAESKTTALATARCVNSILALRQAPASQDAEIYDELWDQIGGILNAPSGSAQGQQAYAKFLVTLAKDTPILNADQAFRLANPLGHCS